MLRKLGNIVDNNEKTIYDEVFNKVSSFDKTDASLPTLIVGMDLAKPIVTNFSVLKRGDGDLRWTFSKTERRSENLEDLKSFKRYCLKKFVEKYKYQYINFTCYPYSKIKKFINYINSEDHKVCFLTKDSRFLFIFSEKYKLIWGLSLSLCDYIGVDKKKVVAEIKKNVNNEIINGASFIDETIREIIGNDTHLMPLLLYYFAKK